MLKIYTIPCLNDNYSYILHDGETNIVAIVDPSEFQSCDKIISKKFKKLDFILNTHHHIDHTGGNKELKKKYNSKILASEKDKESISNVDQFLQNGEVIMIGSTSFEVMFIPGHTLGHIAFYSQSAKVVFTGDTLFSLGCGRIFEGSYKQMFSSINKIKKLPLDTKIYCGHEYTKKNLEFCLKFDLNNKFLIKKSEWIYKQYECNKPTIPTTIDEEKKTNIFLRCDEESVKNALKMNNASEQEIFTKLRDLKDSF